MNIVDKISDVISGVSIHDDKTRYHIGDHNLTKTNCGYYVDGKSTNDPLSELVEILIEDDENLHMKIKFDKNDVINFKKKPFIGIEDIKVLPKINGHIYLSEGENTLRYILENTGYKFSYKNDGNIILYHSGCWVNITDDNYDVLKNQKKKYDLMCITSEKIIDHPKNCKISDYRCSTLESNNFALMLDDFKTAQMIKKILRKVYSPNIVIFTLNKPKLPVDHISYGFNDYRFIQFDDKIDFSMF